VRFIFRVNLTPGIKYLVISVGLGGAQRLFRWAFDWRARNESKHLPPHISDLFPLIAQCRILVLMERIQNDPKAAETVILYSIVSEIFIGHSLAYRFLLVFRERSSTRGTSPASHV